MKPYDISRDLQELSCSVRNAKDRWVDLRLSGGKLTLSCEDFGPSCRLMSGKDSYEFCHSFSEAATEALVRSLREEYGTEKEFSVLFRELFGADDGLLLLDRFCSSHGIAYATICL